MIAKYKVLIGKCYDLSVVRLGQSSPELCGLRRLQYESQLFTQFLGQAARHCQVLLPRLTCRCPLSQQDKVIGNNKTSS